MFGFCPLSSGSGGNSCYLGTEKTRILFDVGISFKKLKERLEDIHIDINSIQAVIISHEHADHIKGLEMIVKKLGVPILCNSDTAKAICQMISVKPKFRIFSTGESFSFGDLEIHPFSIQHDTLDPVAFTVKFGNIKVGLCTDLGFASNLVASHLMECDYLLLEANHEEEMVHACARPMIYKQRVLGRQGHLSNKGCGELLSKIHSDRLKHVFLAHLSSECNHPDVAIKTVQSILQREKKVVALSIAYQDRTSDPIFFERPSVKEKT